MQTYQLVPVISILVPDYVLYPKQSDRQFKRKFLIVDLSKKLGSNIGTKLLKFKKIGRRAK